MRKYEGKILLSDIDGTLLNKEGVLSAKNREAIRYFVDEGGKFGIATGRSLTNALGLLEDIPINGYCILGNGGLLYDFKTRTYLEEYGLIKKETVCFLQRCLKERPKIGIQVYGRDMGYIVSQKEMANPQVVQDHFPIQFACLNDVVDINWIKILFFGTEEDIEWLEKESAYLEKNKIVDRVRSAITYYEFLPVNINKGTMLNKLRRYTNKHYTIYAVGDYYNDLEMIKQADVGIAMGNAPELVKSCADYICKDCDQSAIAEVINYII